MKVEMYADRRETPVGSVLVAGAIFSGGAPVRKRSFRTLPDFALVWVTGGEAEYLDANGFTELSPGDMIAVLPSHAHLYGPKPGSFWDEAYVVLRGDIANMLQEAATRSASQIPVFSAVPGASPLRPLELLRQMKLTEDESEFLRLLWEVCGIGIDQISRSASPISVALSEHSAWIDQARQMLSSNLREPLKVADVAAAVQVGQEVFRKRFTEVVGVSPAAFRIEAKIAAARSILSYAPETSALEMASYLGFSDASHFWRTFQKHVGLTPRQYVHKVAERT